MISIIDDDQCVRDATADLVESLGYNVRKFHSAEHFLQSGEIAATDCVITDLQMPGLNGLDLQERLLAKGHKTPVIFITAFPEQRFEQRARNAGAAAFLGKPFDVRTFANSIGAALNRNAD
jgi:FixJ family two-component response regulator